MRKSTLLVVGLICFAAVAAQAQNTAIKVNPNGNVAIGQAEAAEKLDVAGNIKASGALIANQLKAAVGSVLTLTGNVTVVKSPGGNGGDGKITADGDISTKGRIKDKTGFVMPVGTILPYAGATAPEGWILCDGRALSRTDPNYTELFAAIGIAWGAPDANTFNVPDLRGMFLRGVAGDATTDPDKTTRTASKSGGNAGNAVGSKQMDMFKSHSHGIPRDRWTGSEDTLPFRDDNGGTDWNMGTGSAGGSETRPVNVYVNYIIKY